MINNIFIQARINSKRLPNKMMMKIHNHPIIYWVYHRVKKVSNYNKLIFLIPDSETNDDLYAYLKKLDVEIFRGDEKNLVKRFYDALEIYPCDNVIRVCADNPLICHKEIQKLIDFFLKNSFQFAYNNIPDGNNCYPDGLGAEICKSELINELYNKILNNEEKEHVFNYIKDNKSCYKIGTFLADPEIAYPKLKLDIDTKEDYDRIVGKKINIDMDGKSIVKKFIS